MTKPAAAQERTIRFYDQNAAQYFQDTVQVDMSESRELFLRHVPPGGRIVDVGAGSGRDLKYFRENGFEAEGIDASRELCRLASAYAGAEVRCQRIQDWQPHGLYDGIWANASLLHLSLDEIRAFLRQVHPHLKPRGVLYFSMKKGIPAGYDPRGRYFTHFSEEILRQWLAEEKTYDILTCRTMNDQMGRNGLQWLSFLLGKRDRGPSP